MTANRTHTQTGFRVPDELIGKLKYIAWSEITSMNAEAEKAFKSHIEKWEKKNGAITKEMIGKVSPKK